MKNFAIAFLALVLTGCGGVDNNPLYTFVPEEGKAWIRTAEKFNKECPNLNHYIHYRKPIPEDHPGGPWTPDKVEKCQELYQPVMARIDPERYEVYKELDKWEKYSESDAGKECQIYYTTKDSDLRDHIIQQWSLQEHNECLEYLAYLKSD